MARPPLRKRFLPLAVGLGVGLTAVIVFAMCMPVVRIAPETCAEIRPGMEIEEVEKIIGGRPGAYDGVWGWQSGAPHGKVWQVQSWISSQGEIAVEVDGSLRVARAGYYPIRIKGQNQTEFVWERLTRGVFRDLSRQHRDMAYGIVAALIVAVVFVGIAFLGWEVRALRAVDLLLIVAIALSLTALVLGVDEVSWMLTTAGATGIALSCAGGIFYLLLPRSHRRSVFKGV